MNIEQYFSRLRSTIIITLRHYEWTLILIKRIYTWHRVTPAFWHDDDDITYPPGIETGRLGCVHINSLALIWRSPSHDWSRLDARNASLSVVARSWSHRVFGMNDWGETTHDPSKLDTRLIWVSCLSLVHIQETCIFYSSYQVRVEHQMAGTAR